MSMNCRQRSAETEKERERERGWGGGEELELELREYLYFTRIVVLGSVLAKLLMSKYKIRGIIYMHIGMNE